MATDTSNLTHPKLRRLLTRERFLAMNGRGQSRLKTEAFLVVAKPNKLNHNRLGVTVTKKVGKAVTRNRFKRVAREFFRLNQSGWPQGFDLLFIALQGQDPFRKGLLDQARSQVEDFLAAAARKFSTPPFAHDSRPRD